MEYKIILQDLCKNLESELNDRHGTYGAKRVSLFNGLKPENYFSPAIHIGTSKSINEKVRIAWFVEIWVDGKAIFRGNCIPEEGEDLEALEAMLMRNVLRRVFAFGVMSSKKFIDENFE